MLTGAALAAAMLLTGIVAAEDALKSGPQPGDKFPGAFHPLNLTNVENPKAAGKKNCYV
jgi:hypothetical protein